MSTDQPGAAAEAAGSIARSPFAAPGSSARYSLLADSIIGDIGAGRYAVGSLLPTEAQLSAQFGVSRHTVREALRRVREMGLVSRHRASARGSRPSAAIHVTCSQSIRSRICSPTSRKPGCRS